MTITFTEPANGWIEITKLLEHEKSSATSVKELQANAIVLESIHQGVPDDITFQGAVDVYLSWWQSMEWATGLSSLVYHSTYHTKLHASLI